MTASTADGSPRASEPAPGPGSSGALVRGLGPVAAIALVTGNMIGSGIFVIPASLAETAGPIGLLAWLVNVLGYLCLTAVFADLGGAYPVSGGLQAFARRAFGPLAGMEVGYLYWLCAVIGNAAFLTAFTEYLGVFAPGVAAPWAAFLISQLLLWSLTLANALGVRAGGVVQIVTTALKLLPLIVLGALLLPHAEPANLEPLAPHGSGALLPAISLVSWMFIGMESITVPAEEIRGAGRTIRRSVYGGFVLTSVVYALVLLSVTLAVPTATLAGSGRPLAEAAGLFYGPSAAKIISATALVSIAGILNGWLLVTSRMLHATARAGLAPAALARLSPRFGTPVRALLLSSTLTGLLVLLYFSGTMLEIYNFIALFSTATALVAVGFACVAQLVLMRREPERFSPRQRVRGRVTAALGLAVVILMINGSGLRIIALTGLCMLAPTPYYLWLRRRWRRQASAYGPLSR
ncbi:MAG: APC family permease [Myxococcales bacterium]|nr:APC family permease [Myxococcales bacterium]MCB9754045.1 APC family permease [Myxococcales bacterium]